MSHLSRSIFNPLIGDTVTFLETASETNGKYCLVKVFLPPGGGNDLHYHTMVTEKFKIITGTLNVQVGKEKLTLTPGQTYVIERNAVHRFYNENEEPVEFECMIAPARQFEQLLRAVYGLATDNKCNPKTGIPKNPFFAGILFQMGESYLPDMPLWLQKGLFGTLAAIGTGLGFKRQLYKYYKGTIEPQRKKVQSFRTPVLTDV